MSVKSNGYTSTLNKKPLKHYLNNDFDKDFLTRKMGLLYLWKAGLE